MSISEISYHNDYGYSCSCGLNHEQTENGPGETGGSTGGGNAAPTVVDDFTALTAYLDTDYFRWNGFVDAGTPTVVSYSFSNTPTLAEYNPRGASGYWSFDTTQQAHFRSVLDDFAAASGLMFVEVDGEAMINVFGAEGVSIGGWADYALATQTETGAGNLVTSYETMTPGTYGYQILMHELGHALGLSHPHDGQNRILRSDLDTQPNTVMTYNIETPYVSDLGTFDIQALRDIYGPANGLNVWTAVTNANGTPVISASGRSEIVLAVGQSSHVFAGSGDDTVYGREGDDLIYGQAGDDTIQGGDGEDSIYGGRGADVIWGDIDIYNGFGDGDLLAGGTGNDILEGGYGDDRAYGQQDDDTIRGGFGEDTLNGGSGNDSLLGEADADRIAGIDGDDTLDGGSANDTLVGGEGDDSLIGGTGDDLLRGGDDADTLEGGTGADHLRGDGGGDVLLGGTGDDLLRGFEGNDTLDGGDGADRMLGGSGADLFVFGLLDAFETNRIYDFEDGIDTIRIEELGLTFADMTISSAGVTGAHSIVSYSNWFDLVIFNVAASDLTTSDFIFD